MYKICMDILNTYLPTYLLINTINCLQCYLLINVGKNTKYSFYEIIISQHIGLSLKLNYNIRNIAKVICI